MKDLIILKKYFLKKPSVDFIEPGLFEGIIKFEADGRVTLKEGAYLTTNEFNSADEAQKYLSITYSPKYECKFEINKINRNGIELKNPYLGDEPTRVWPAFAKCGGSCEIILTQGKLKYNKVKEKFPYGGKPDFFHQDSTKSDKIFVSHLAKILWNWLKKRKDERPEKERLAMKIMDGLGAVISWLGISSHKFYSISCAYKENENKDFVNLRFWGYIWDDSENDRRRILSKPVIKDFHANFGIEELKKKLNQMQYPKSEIESILLEIHDFLIPIALNFYNYNNDRIDLPSYVSLYG